jgi:serine/threonine-protein kinase
LAEAHLSLGLALGARYDLPGAENAVRKAIQPNPRLAAAWDQLAWLLLATGREYPETARRWRPRDLEPTSVAFANSYSAYLYFARRHEAALEQVRRVIAMDSSFANAHNMAGACLTVLGRYAEAEAEFSLMEKLVSAPFSRAVHGWAHGRAGNRARAEQILAELEELAKQRLVSAGCRVLLYVGIGEKQKALDWLERAAEDQDWFCWQMRIDPALDSLRDEPRFKALVKKVGLEK